MFKPKEVREMESKRILPETKMTLKMIRELLGYKMCIRDRRDSVDASVGVGFVYSGIVSDVFS